MSRKTKNTILFWSYIFLAIVIPYSVAEEGIEYMINAGPSMRYILFWLFTLLMIFAYVALLILRQSIIEEATE